MITDPIGRAIELRKTIISEDKKRILVVDFTNTLQGKDTSKVIDLMPNISTNSYIFRTKINVKDIDPAAAKIYEKDFFDIETKSKIEIEEHLRNQEFDFPLWYKHTRGFSMRKIMDYNVPFIFQVAGCNFHDGSAKGGCHYCFVDDISNNGINEKGKSTLSIDEVINSMISAREKISDFYYKIGKDVKIKVLRSSGGEPTIVLDWILNMWREIKERNGDFVGQLDTNLSTGQVVDFFEKEGVFEKYTLEKLAEHPVKVLTALKGTDEKNLEKNVQAKTTMEAQKYSLKRMLKSGLDIYPQLYNPNPKSLQNFLECMDKEIENFSLRVHIGPLKLYGPNKLRLKLEAKAKHINQEIFIKKTTEKWQENYEQSCEIIDSYLRKVYGIGYKQITRADVPLLLRKKL